MSNVDIQDSPEIRINAYYVDDKEKDLTTVRATKSILEIDQREVAEIPVQDMVADVDRPGDIVRVYIENGVPIGQVRKISKDRIRRAALENNKEDIALAKNEDMWISAHYPKETPTKTESEK